METTWPSLGKDRDNSASSSDTVFQRLPIGLLTTLESYLPNRDIKNLRLTSSAICARVTLRLDRVLISASPRDIEVFRAIADHETYLKAIKEIIWDDALLSDEELVARPEFEAYAPLWETPPPEGCPRWFARGCEESMSDLEQREGNKYCARLHRADFEPDSIEAASPEWAARAKQLEDQHHSTCPGTPINSFYCSKKRFCY